MSRPARLSLATALLLLALGGAPGNVSANTVVGHVYYSTGGGGTAPLAQVCVQAWDSANPPWSPSGPVPPLYEATTDTLGYYELHEPGNPANTAMDTTKTYKVQFSHCPFPDPPQYVSEWFDDKVNNWQDAAFISVAAGNYTANATLDPGHSISGHVTNLAHLPLKDICVSVYATTNQFFSYAGGMTDDSGAYTTQPVPYRDYKVRFDDCSAPYEYYARWYGGADDFDGATPFSVTSAGDVGGIDVTLEPGFTISGTVTEDSVAGGPLADICVNVNTASVSGPSVAFGKTGLTGAYTTQAVKPGQSYKIQFSDCSASPTHVGEWYDNKPDPGSADQLLVDSNKTVDAALKPGFHVIGRVTNGSTGIEGIDVMVQQPGGPMVPGGFAKTGVGGNFTTGLVPAGTYKLFFRDGRTVPQYRSEFWENRTDLSNADSVPLGPSDYTLPRDVVLDPGRTIHGRVVIEGTTTGVEGICVSTFDATTGWGGPSRWTDASGYFYTEPVVAGEYKLQFKDCRQTPSYVTEWWHEATGSTAVKISLLNGNVDLLPGVEELTTGPTISGTVTAASGGSPLGNICVNATVADSPQGTPPTDGTMTRPDGTYTLVLPPATYNVYFQDCNWGNQTYVAEWAHNTQDVTQALDVNILLTNQTVDESLVVGHKISGTVTDSVSHASLQGLCVGAYPPGSHGWPEAGPAPYWATTDGTGHYSLGPMPAANWHVQFGDCMTNPPRYFAQWYNGTPEGAPDYTGAIDVPSGDDPTNINAALVLGETVTGTVTAEAGGAPLEGICVSAFDTGWDPNSDAPPIAGTRTDSNGHFTLSPFHAGQTMLVQFNDCNDPQHYLGEWYDNSPGPPDPQTQVVTAGDVITAQLTRGYTISGTVRDANGAALQNQRVCVDVVDANNPDKWVGWGNARDDGTYTTSALPANAYYKLQFSDCTEPPALPVWVREWYGGASDWDNAEPVHVIASDLSGYDVLLDQGHTISGTVKEDGTNAPLGNICVDVFRSSDGNYLGGGGTDNTGAYRTEPLRDGTYVLGFGQCDGPETHVYEYYKDVYRWQDWQQTPPQQINIAGADIGPIDASLAPGFTVSGRVTNANGEGIPSVCLGLVQAGNQDAWVGGGNTDNQGYYTTEAVLPGHYNLNFNDCNQTVLYVSEWYDNQPDFNINVADIDLTTLSAVEKNAVLARGGGISGRVRAGSDGTGPGLGKICVDAYRTDGPGWGWAMTASDGTYRVGGLPSGTYDVNFSDCREDPSGAAYEWHHVGGVAVTAPNDTTGVNVNMGELDSTVPNTFITSGPIGTTDATTAVFSFAADEQHVDFSCSLDGPDNWAQCSNPVTFTDLAPGTHTLLVAANDWAGHVDQSPATRTWTVSGTSQSSHTTSGSLPPAGGTVSDDPLGSGASASVPVTTSVTAPGSNTIEITAQPTSTSPPSGWSLFGSQVSIASSAPATAGSPFHIVFTLDSSLVGSTPLSDIGVFRNGTAVPQCSGVSIADPDPCVLSRASVAGGDVQLTILSSQTSTWNFGARIPAPTTPGKPLGTPAVTQGGLTVTWAASTGATSYTLQMQVSGGTWADVSSGIVTTAYSFPTAAPEGTLVFRVKAVGAGGESAWSATSDPVIVDRTGPTVSLDSARQLEHGTTTDLGAYSAGTWTPNDVRVTYTASDGAGSGVATIEHQLDGGGWAAGASLTVTTEGDHTVSFRATDNAANVSAVADFLVRINRSLPIISPDALTEDITTTGAEIGATVNPNGSATTYHFDYGLTTGYGMRAPALDAAVASDSSDHYVSEIITGLLPGRIYHFRVVATNTAGTNSGGDHTFVTPPEPPGKPAPSAAVTQGSLGISWSAGTGAVTYTLQMQQSGGGWTDVQAGIAGTSYDFPLVAPEGTLVFRVKAIGQGAGESAWSPTSNAVVVDRTAPSAPTVAGDRGPEYAGDGGWFRDAVTVSFAAAGDNTGGSGVDPASVPTAQRFATTGAHTASGTVTDLAGNHSTAGSLTVKVDADAPQTAISCPGPVTVGATAAAHWTAGDTGAGLATAAAGDVALDTTSAGTRTAVAPDARDLVGHVAASASCSYTVNTVAPPAKPVVAITTKKVTATAKGVVPVKLKCTGAACKGTLTLKATFKQAGKKKTVTLGRKAFSLQAGATGTVSFKLSKANLALLKRQRKLAVTATAALTGAIGSPATAKITLSAPQRATVRSARRAA